MCHRQRVVVMPDRGRCPQNVYSLGVLRETLRSLPSIVALQGPCALPAIAKAASKISIRREVSRTRREPGGTRKVIGIPVSLPVEDDARRKSAKDICLVEDEGDEFR